MHPKVPILIIISSTFAVCNGRRKDSMCSAQVDLCSPCLGATSTGEGLSLPVPIPEETKVKELQTDIREFKKGLQYLSKQLNNVSSMLHMKVAIENDALDFQLIRKTLLGKKLRNLKLRGSRMQKQIQDAYAKIAALVTTIKLTSCVETSLMETPYNHIYTEALHVLCKLSKINKVVLGKSIKKRYCSRKDKVGYLTGTKQIDFTNQVVEKAKHVVKELIQKWVNCRLKIRSKGKKLRLVFNSRKNKNNKKPKVNKKKRKGRRKPKRSKKSKTE